MMLKIAVLGALVALAAGAFTDFECFEVGGVPQERGTSWIQDKGDGRFKECVCPYHLASESDTWTRREFCNGICYKGDNEYRYTKGDTWREVSDVGTRLNCECGKNGVKVCFPRCVWQGEEHETGERWVQEVQSGRKKECWCPEKFPEGVINWNVLDFCRGRCVVEGKVIYQGETAIRTRTTGVEVECLCKPHSMLICDVLDEEEAP